MSNRVSEDQIDLLTEYLRSYPYLATGVGAGARSKESIKLKWEELACRLNALGSGSTKTADRWKSYWGDIKFKAKHRAALNSIDLNETAGGPPNPGSKMTVTDHKVLSIIGHAAVFGDTQHRIPLSKSHTQPRVAAENEENSCNSPLAVAVEENEVPLFTSQSTTNISTEDPQVTVEVEEERAAEHALAMPVNLGSPSTSGQTTTKTSVAENTARHSHYKSTRRLFHPAQIDSPASAHRTRATRIRCPKTSNQVNATPTWVMELERRRVEAEENLSKAALVTAEASRVQAEGARSQVEILRMFSESVATLAKLLEDKK